jgi:hypothetical protein
MLAAMLWMTQLTPVRLFDEHSCFVSSSAAVRGHRLNIDAGLLRALLEVPSYRNGARSLEKLALSLKPVEPTAAIRRSSLGSPEQLAMFVDFPPATSSTPIASGASGALTPAAIYCRFMELCRQHEPFQTSETIESLAASVHGFYQPLATQPGMTIQEINNREYALLPEDSKESNRSAARRISEVLAVAGLKLITQSEASSLVANHDVIIAAILSSILRTWRSLSMISGVKNAKARAGDRVPRATTRRRFIAC